MTLELKRKECEGYPNISTVPYNLIGVQSVSKDGNYCQIEIFDKRSAVPCFFEYIKNADTGEFYVKDGRLCM